MSDQVTYRDFIEVSKRMQGWDNKTKTLIEALNIVKEESPGFNLDGFLGGFGEFLVANGVIKEATPNEIFLLDAKVLSRYGRNYRMFELIESVACIYMFRECIPRSNLEIYSNVQPEP